MTTPLPPDRIAHLQDRGVVAVSGIDAGGFLDNLITNDMGLLETAPALFAGLLSPQGKILFEFFVIKHADGYLIDTARDRVADLLKRLTMYKLRAKVTLEDVSSRLHVVVSWGDAAVDLPSVTFFPDPRDTRLGWRGLVTDETIAASNFSATLASAYNAHRIGCGVPEGGTDYPLGDTFPHEANFDRLHGVSFTKGCYVGQEVVARMENKTVVRKRVVQVTGSGLAPGANVMAGEAVIGGVRSVASDRGLAMVRLDRLAQALDEADDVTVNNQRLTVDPDVLARYRQSVIDQPSSKL
jgi:tRNA-modifying protein YgfZ